MSNEYVPGIVDEPTSEEMAILSRAAMLLEKNARLLSIHLREITNNERYQHHKGILKARRREVVSMKQHLDFIDEELLALLESKVQP